MFSRLFHQSGVPQEYRTNFRHLYLDVAWFGVASGTAINFLNIYAVRLGATGIQIGLIAGLSGIVNLLLALPAGRWLASRQTSRAIFWSSVFYRLGYVLWIPLPSLFSNEIQIRALILINFLMAIPLTPLSVGFNALFAEAVPLNWRAHVAGVRNFTLASTFIISSLISGFILKIVGFPTGYQIVFTLGALASAMSSYHLFFVQSLNAGQSGVYDFQLSKPLPPAQPSPVRSPLLSRRLPLVLRLDVWRTPFRSVLLVLLGFHLAQYLALPIFPLYNVRVLNLGDDQIGAGTALFYTTVLIGSTQFGRLVQRLGHKKVTAWGVAGMGLYPLMLAFTTHVWQYYALSLVGGWMWAMVGGAYANYMLERIPDHDRPSHLAWYNIVLNSAILAGSLIGPVIANQMGLSGALLIFAGLRFLAGLCILIWG